MQTFVRLWLLPELNSIPEYHMMLLLYQTTIDRQLVLLQEQKSDPAVHLGQRLHVL